MKTGMVRFPFHRSLESRCGRDGGAGDQLPGCLQPQRRPVYLLVQGHLLLLPRPLRRRPLPLTGALGL
jgi:hypothetical protein